MSYPYIEYEGYKFSLIEPFTIDDKLITNIEFNVERETVDINDYGYVVSRVVRNATTTIEVKLHTGERLGFQLLHNFDNPYAEHIIQNIMREYVDRNIYNNINQYVYRECMHMLGEDINHLLSDVQEQCENIMNGYSYSYYNSKLRHQDRPLLDSCDYNRYRYDFASTISLSDCYNNIISTISSSNNYTIEKEKIIHSHTYIPEYKKHYLSGEHETTTLLLGAEIEVDCGGESEKHAKKVLEIMNGKETWNSEENIYCVHDGSLTEKSLDSFIKKVTGMEFPTQPASLAYHKTLPYKEMFKYLDENGYKAHDTKTCGLHIHINRSFFGKNELECIGKLMYIIEKFNDEFSIIGRRSCQYARMLGYNGEKCKELYQKGSRLRDKYNAINLLHTDTIEIRAFKGTLKYSTFMNTLEFVYDLAHFVKNHTEEEIENMEWADLYNTFSDDLKKYYDERKKIESEKNKKEKSEIGTNYIDCSRFSTGRLFIDNIDIGINIDNATTSLQNTFNSYEQATTHDLLMNLYEIYYGNTSEEPKEKKLKRLKKQLKTEQNYMTKQDLKRQIQELQKEIKQEKKQKKQNTSN